MQSNQLKDLLNDLVKQTNESEWVEFKLNFHSNEEIGERISALSNGACIHNQPFGYLVFGVEDKTHKIVGTTFKPKSHKKGNEDFEHWLVQRLSPRIDFRIRELVIDDKFISLFVIPATTNKPVNFLNEAYIRIGSITRKLLDFPEKERKIWKKENKPYEIGLAKEVSSKNEIIQLLSTETYFNLMKIPYPSSQDLVIDKLISEKLIVRNKGLFCITNICALLFAKDLTNFDKIERKSVRVIVYNGKSKVETEREQIGKKGYALGFEGLVDWINSQLPANEEIGKVLREESRMYPQIVIRELVANALIHQDLSMKGFPMIEIYSDRIEISNPGMPLISPDRFIDSYTSRNDKLADLMRRMGFCEEKGSGLDKVIFYNEFYQLPPINVMADEYRTRVTIYSYKKLNALDKKEKIRATYQHACLKWVSNDKMTNQSLRERFLIEDQNASIASRIIKDTLNTGMIKEEDPDNKSRKHRSYIPFWA